MTTTAGGYAMGQSPADFENACTKAGGRFERQPKKDPRLLGIACSVLAVDVASMKQVSAMFCDDALCGLIMAAPNVAALEERNHQILIASKALRDKYGPPSGNDSEQFLKTGAAGCATAPSQMNVLWSWPDRAIVSQLLL